MVNPQQIAALSAILRAGGIADAELEAKWIAEDIPDFARAAEIAERRAKHEPLQYLLGKWEFYGLTLRVGEGVLIPRADTETLVDAVLDRLRGRIAPKIVDLCTGSGCIALAIASKRPDAKIVGIEKSHDAMQYAVTNALTLRLPVQFFHGDVLAAQTRQIFGGLDVIVCNPPYLTDSEMAQMQQELRYEPAQALSGGPDGLDFYRGITALWQDALKPGGCIVYEVGWQQAEAVAEILTQNGFSEIERLRDLGGNYRAVVGKRVHTS